MSELRVATGTPLVVDSSVAFKWFYRQESGAQEALALLDDHLAERVALVAPDVLQLEVLNGLVCREREAQSLEGVVQYMAGLDLLLAPIEEWLLSAAFEVALEEHIALYDALFIALAERLEAPLVTADRRQASTRRCAVRLIG